MITQYCTFYVGGLFFGVDVLKVQEVIRHQPMTRVPLAPAMVRGLINLRGQIVTAIDMRSRLALEPFPPDFHAMNVVLRLDDCSLSMLVDEIGEVIHVKPEAHERTPDNLVGPARQLVRNVCKLENVLMLVLAEERLWNIPEGVAA